MDRRRAREKALQILFQIDAQQSDANETIAERFEIDNVSDKQKPFITDIVLGTYNNLAEIDLQLKEVLEGWELNRIGKVELCVLRIAFYELLFTDLSESIVINEAVELAKTFSTNQSASFVNGILAKQIKK